MEQAKNHRPICALSVLYKLFDILLYARLQPKLEGHLQKNQAAFRKHFSTVDHIQALSQVQEKTHEWQIEIWACFLDFQKASDSVEHKAI